MKTLRTIVLMAAVLAALGISAKEYGEWRAMTAHIAATAARGEGNRMRVEVTALEQQLRTETARAEGAEKEGAQLLQQAQAAKAGARPRVPPTGVRLTRDLVDARFKRGQELAQQGDFAGALQEYLWCYDTGMASVPGYAQVRSRMLLERIGTLGEQFSPAREALRQRAAVAEQAILADEGDMEAANELITINRALKEDARTLEFVDELPEDDRRREYFGRGLFETLVTTRRYGDALRVRPYEHWLDGLESTIKREQTRHLREPAQRAAIAAEESTEAQKQAQLVALERAVRVQRQAAITSSALGIEILAGAGDVAHAQELAAKLLAFDGSAETRALLRHHVERAGQPLLLPGLDH